MTPEDLEGAIAAVRAGRQDRYRSVIEALRGPVTLVVAAIVPDPGVVDDVAHETFLTAYLKLGDYTPGTDFRAWVKEIARKLALNERRRWLAQQRARDSYQRVLEEEAEPLIDAFAAAVDAETRSRIEDCLAGLTVNARRLVEGYYFQGRVSADMAREEQKTESWVRVTLLRARTALADCLAAKGVLRGG